LTTATLGAAIKLAPAALVDQDWSGVGEREWIQSSGECRQQVLWLGELAANGGVRSATIVDDSGKCAARIEGRGDAPLQMAAGPAKYIYDPAAAVLAAGLLDELALELELPRAAADTSYLTSDQLVTSPLVAAFRVQDVLPFDRKRLKRYVREHRLGKLEIKKRGIDVQPEQLMRDLRNDGDERATLLILRINKKGAVIVAQRC